jgi:hypothetical protein
VSYARFLAAWYNLAFLALVAAGLCVHLAGRLTGRDTLRASSTLVISGVLGLTANGALHDFGIGGYATHFPWVLGGALLIGAAGGTGLAALRRRMDRSFVRRMILTPPGAESGSGADPDPPSDQVSGSSVDRSARDT